MTPSSGINQQEATLETVGKTIFRPLGEKDGGPDESTNPGRSLMLNPNPRSGVKEFHKDANCARNCG